MSELLRTARRRERLAVMRQVSAVAIELFDERGFDQVTMETVATASGISPATLYRWFGTKENLVCWQPDEDRAMTALVCLVDEGMSVLRAAEQVAAELPEEGIEAIETTARTRLALIASHPSLRAAAQQKAGSFVTTLLSAGASDERALLARETEIRCVAAALDAANQAWLRGEGPLRACALEALAVLRDLGRGA